MSKVHIQMTDHGKGRVFIDGKELECVQSIEFSAAAGREPNLLKLQILASDVEIEALSKVEIGDSLSVGFIRSE